MADAVCIRVARFATPTSVNGTTDWTTADLGGLTPKAVMIIATRADTDGVVEAGLSHGIGFADGTTEISFSGSSEDNLGTSDCDRISSDSAVIDLIVAGVSQVVASFDSFITDGVRLTFSVVDSDAQLYTVIFFAGSAVSAHVNKTTELVDEATKDITDPGFQPDLVFVLVDGVRIPDEQTSILFSFGVGVRDGSDTNKVILSRSLDARDTTGNQGRFQNDAAGGLPVQSDFWTVLINDYHANGFSIVHTGEDPHPAEIGYLALSFGGSANVWLSSLDSPTGTGDDVQAGPAFKPQFVMLGMTDVPTENVFASGADKAAYGISVFDKDGNEFSNAWADETSQDTTDTQSLADDQAVNFASPDGSQQFAATFSSMNPLGYTLNYSVADGTVRKWFGLAIEEIDLGEITPSRYSVERFYLNA